jgi:hypothetical protein
MLRPDPTIELLPKIVNRFQTKPVRYLDRTAASKGQFPRRSNVRLPFRRNSGDKEIFQVFRKPNNLLKSVGIHGRHLYVEKDNHRSFEVQSSNLHALSWGQ